MGRSWPLLGGSWALLAGPWGTKIDFPTVLVAEIDFSKNIEKHKEKQRFLRSWPPRVALESSWVALRTSWGGLGPLLVSPSPSAGLGAFWVFAVLHSLHLPFSHLNFTQLNTTQPNSTQLLFGPSAAPILEPLGRPNRPKTGQSRLLTPYFFENLVFHEIVRFPIQNHNK